MNNNKLLVFIGVCVFFVCLISPVIIYIYHFGLSLSAKNSDWGDFGSFISGIYTPIISLLTILILFLQLKLQADFNKVEIDSKAIKKSSEDISHHLNSLLLVIDQKSSKYEKTYRELLGSFSVANKNADLLNQHFYNLAIEINYSAPQLYAAWSGINSILIGLSTPSNYAYELGHSSEKHKLMSSLTFKTCVELDNFQESLTNNTIKTRYFFSPLLCGDN